MESSGTIGDVLLTLYEMGFNEKQVQAAIQAGFLSVQEATEWLLQGGQERWRLQTVPAHEARTSAIAAFNLPCFPQLQEPQTSPEASATENSPQACSLIPCCGYGDGIAQSSRLRLEKQEFEEKQRVQLAQEVKTERRNKKREHELVMQRIADDRKSFQEKAQQVPKLDLPPQPSQKLESKVLRAGEARCLLMIRLPSGDSFRQCFPASAPLGKVKGHISELYPYLHSFSLLQTFPRRHFSQAELSESLESLGLMPSATLCVSAEPSANEAAPSQDQGASAEPLSPRLQVLPDDSHIWGEGEVLGVHGEAANPEVLFQEGEEPLSVLNSPVHGVASGNPGIRGLSDSTSRHHHWGRGQRLVAGDEDAEGDEQDLDGGNMEEEGIDLPGFARVPAPPWNRGEEREDHHWPATGHRLRVEDPSAYPVFRGSLPSPEDLPGLMVQAAVQRLQHPAQEDVGLPQQPFLVRKLSRAPQVPSLFHLTLRATVLLMTAPCMQYCSSLSSLTPELAEHLIAYMVQERILRPRILELFFGCPILKIVLNCYPYATNELLRQLQAFQSLKHLSLVSCPLITDQGMVVVKHLQKLQYLNLCACMRLTDTTLHCVKGLSHLSHLVLDQTKVTDAGVIDYLSSTPACLTQLSLNQTDVTDKTLCVLPEHVSQLRVLSIKQTKVSDLSALQKLKSLHTLHLDNTGIVENSLLPLSAHPALSTLTLSGIQSMDGDMALQLISGLNLVHLALPSRHSITDVGLSFLCHFQDLLELDLTDYSHITDEGIRSLNTLIRMKKLSLSNTLLTDSGLLHLQNLHHLEDLCLDRTSVTSAGVSKCIPHLPHLQVLGLASTHVGDNVIKLGIRQCKQLLKLNLSRTRVTDKGLRYLRHMKISQLNLNGSGVTLTGVANLLDVCPSVISVRASNLQVLSPDQVSDDECSN
ncbi:uncharacterized protein LOC115461903 [Microcaecilia unicolor]|uniref:Uncharacterized protein LOC115461903 n=1 Tax=Microcaecilia unicolor TaxID=1415580 RepID=A0A6P7WX86_9AMPH|nr:uncharacterized protein LOC115461903 [Microcaecilia unicolor]